MPPPSVPGQIASEVRPGDAENHPVEASTPIRRSGSVSRPLLVPFVTLLVVLSLAVGYAIGQYYPARPEARYEYMVLTIDFRGSTGEAEQRERLDRLLSEGWEIDRTFVQEIEWGDRRLPTTDYYLKRVKE